MPVVLAALAGIHDLLKARGGSAGVPGRAAVASWEALGGHPRALGRPLGPSTNHNIAIRAQRNT